VQAAEADGMRIFYQLWVQGFPCPKRKQLLKIRPKHSFSIQYSWNALLLPWAS